MNRLLVILATITLCVTAWGRSVEQMPCYPGGDSALLRFLLANQQYPINCRDSLIEGRVIVQFIVTVDGTVDSARVVRSAHPDLDREALRLVGTLTDSVRFTPARKNGEPTRSWYTLPVTFKARGENSYKLNEWWTKGEIYDTPQQMPTFPGGEVALEKFINTHMLIAQWSRRANQDSTLVVRFIIDETGKVGETKLLNYSKWDYINTEIVRLVKSLPRFTPARHDGQAVKCRYTLPITIRPLDNYPDVSDPMPEGEVYDKVDERPQFPTGRRDLLAILESPTIPQEFVNEKFWANIHVKFVVKADGSIGNVIVTDPLLPEFDAEAVRLVKSLSRFIPGRKNGKPVDCWVNESVKFNTKYDHNYR